jgi:hypothetical protein
LASPQGMVFGQGMRCVSSCVIFEDDLSCLLRISHPHTSSEVNLAFLSAGSHTDGIPSWALAIDEATFWQQVPMQE